MTKILVTGGAGFIGFHTCARLLQDGYDVIAIDNLNDYYDPALKQARLQLLDNFQNFQFVQGDIADKNALEQLWRDKGPFLEVIHLAAQAGVRYSLDNPYSYITSNCMGHITVMEMCRHTPGFKHLVYASSSSVYGRNKKLPYAIGDAVDEPVSLYAATKRADELMSYTYSHLFNIPQTGLRFFTVYGPWGRPEMAPYIFTQAIAEGRKVPVFNQGDMRRDFTYIDDIVDGIMASLKSPPTEQGGAASRVLNLGNARSEPLLGFIQLIEKALGKKADIAFLPMQPGDVEETYADITETTALIGYRPRVTLEQGVERYVAWHRDFYGV